MKKSVIPILLFVILYGALNSIQVSGPVSGEWTLAQSPVEVIGDISIEEDNQLIIYPGVDVIFIDHYKFDVYGTLLAQGTETDLIAFTAQNHITGWHSLRFHDTTINEQDLSELNWCYLEYGLAESSRYDYQGGAIYCENSSDLIIQNCVISNNTATTGGAIYLDNSSITVMDSEISNNSASGAAGAVYIKDSSPDFTNVRFLDNTALYDGGAVNCFNSSPTFITCTFAGNLTEWNGGAISCANYSSPQMVNNTIWGNIAYQDGCAIAVLFNSTIDLMNSILWNNDNHEIVVVSTAGISIDYCDIMNGEEDINIYPNANYNWGNGNIDADPLFVDSSNYDFELVINSPCIDAGNPDPIYNDEDGTRNDMGAYSFRQTGLRGNIELEGGTGEVVNVEVNISGDTLITVYPNELGNWFVTLEPGTYTVTAFLVGYTPNPLSYPNLELGDGELISDLDFTMTEILPGYIQGTIDVELGAVGNLLEAEITAGNVTVNPFFVTFPYEHYEYSITINPGTYDVTASLVGFQDSTVTDVVVYPSLITGDIDFVLEVMDYNGYVQGIVTLKGGDGNVENVIVSDEQGYTTNPDITGFYTLETTSGIHSITASLDGYTTVTLDEIQVTVDETTTGINFTLLPWKEIEGNQYVMIINGATATLDGQFICNNLSNQLAAFWVDPVSQEEECRGVAVWEEGNPPGWNVCYSVPGYWYLTIVSNNNSGEEIEIRFYESTTDIIYTCHETLIFEDCSLEHYDFTAPSPTHTQEFDLIEQWNWISFNLEPEDTSIETIFDQLTPDYIRDVKEQYATAYYEEPNWWGDLYTVHTGEGYKINMLQAYENFTISGTRINPLINPLILDYDSQPSSGHNYNWIAFYPYQVLPVEEALDCFCAIIVKSQNKSAVYAGGEWIGDLEIMEPGKMYIVDVTCDAPAYYPSNGCFGIDELPPRATVAEDNNAPGYWELMDGNFSNMIIMAEFYTDEYRFDDSERYAIGVFDAEGNCRSIGKAYEQYWYFTVLGSANNEELHFRVHDLTTGQEFQSNESVYYLADEVMGSTTNPIGYSFDYNSPEVPETLKLYQNYPNPFNPETTIGYFLPESGNVKLEVFNLKGELVNVLINENQNAGYHNYVWNAHKLSSGIYYFKITTKNGSQFKKSVLMK